MCRILNYGEQRESELRERLEQADADVDDYIEELRKIASRDDLRFIDMFDQVLRVKIDNHKYVRVYIIPLADPMFITHVDVGLMDRYYLDTRADLDELLSETILNLADSETDSTIALERSKFDSEIEVID